MVVDKLLHGSAQVHPGLSCLVVVPALQLTGQTTTDLSHQYHHLDMMLMDFEMKLCSPDDHDWEAEAGHMK